ncbi:shikimate kinase [Desulfosporosinus orientis DSM 765]|uniref:Shikimate kinase n=1 Tax=Desulfosporosinus orientis (strain ATCC 19365 / DSM 765 / NCIMB 8382 / VKM B-1628 / Singapore I) TaxID=768706 RepID=G7W833_DESOD|nr:shikimate kinase [Desulfosporosinus orientis]AET66679.1 shikimate kinase [Desulfosporosinus orientis DSM 765]
MRNIVLIGFMGTGKSTVGKRLAQSLAWDFVDTDYEIGAVTDLSVSEIFRRYGETRFRSEESIVVDRISRQERLVIATGGGTALNPANWSALAENGVIIALHATLDAILARIGHKNDRPLLKGPKEAIEKLWIERQKCYAQADYIVDTSQKTVDEVVREILALLERMAKNEFSDVAKD